MKENKGENTKKYEIVFKSKRPAQKSSRLAMILVQRIRRPLILGKENGKEKKKSQAADPGGGIFRAKCHNVQNVM